jgi:HSP20 family protein
MNRRIIRVNPLREMMAMQNALDRFFDESWRPFSADTFALPVDVVEDDTTYTVTTELPGVDSENITVRLDNEYLNIEAEIPEQVIEKKNARLLLKERRYGKFSRRIHLAQPVDSDKIEAVYEDGILTLTLPKVPEVQPKMISVKAGKK